MKAFGIFLLVLFVFYALGSEDSSSTTSSGSDSTSSSGTSTSSSGTELDEPADEACTLLAEHQNANGYQPDVEVARAINEAVAGTRVQGVAYGADALARTAFKNESAWTMAADTMAYHCMENGWK